MLIEPQPPPIRTRCYTGSCQLHVSVEDVKRLFWDDPQKICVGKKRDMVVELVKMLYFDYTLETEVRVETACDVNQRRSLIK